MQKVKITDVCDFQGGTQPPKSEWKAELVSGYVRMLQIRDFTQRNKNYVEYILEKTTTKKCKSDDILIGRYGASIGKICTGLEGAYNVALIKTIPDNKKIIKPFLYYILISDSFQTFINNVGSRAAQAGFNKEDLEGFLIPLPNLPTQQKIANILDKADELRQYNKQLIEKYDALTQSLFLDMFGDPVKNEKGWEKSKLSNNSKIRIGPFGSLLHAEDYIENGIPLVNPTHIKKGKIEIDSKLTISQDKMKELETYKLKTNDLILGRRGEMGRCAIVTPNENGFLCGTGSIFIRPLNNLNINYLYKVISSNSFKQVLENSAKGVTMKNLNSKVVGDLEIPLPPIEIQNNFIKSIENIEAQKQQAQEALTKSEALFQGLLQQAFNGELNTPPYGHPS